MHVHRLTWTFVANCTVVAGVDTSNTSILLEALEHDRAFARNAKVSLLDVKCLKNDGRRRRPDARWYRFTGGKHGSFNRDVAQITVTPIQTLPTCHFESTGIRRSLLTETDGEHEQNNRVTSQCSTNRLVGYAWLRLVGYAYVCDIISNR